MIQSDVVIDEEQALLGYLIGTYPASEMLATFDDSLFASPTNRRIFGVLRECAAKGIRLDVVSVRQYMLADDAKYLADCLHRTPALVDEMAEVWSGIVRKRGTVRKMREILLDADAFSETDAQRIRETLDAADTRIDKNTQDFAVLWPKVMDELAKVGETMPTMAYGYSGLDNATWGIRPGELVTVGAYTSNGKTVFCGAVAYHLTRQGRKVLVFPTEMRPLEYFYGRLIPVGSDVSSSALRRHQITPADRDRVLASKRIWEDSGITFSLLPSPTAQDIRRTVRDVKPDVVVVDHLHRCQMPRSENQVIAVTKFVTAVKTIAVENNVAVIMAAQLNRTSQDASAPTLRHLRDSGGIEMESDAVILLHMPKKDEDLVEVFLAKNRHGRVGAWNLTLDRRRVYFDPAHETEKVL